jgi:predicted amidohydrolase
MKIAVCQMNVVQGDKQLNRLTAEKFIDEAARKGAKVIVLPEMWSCGYDFARLSEHTETLDGVSSRLIASKAEEHGVYIVGGSLPIRFNDGVRNTSITCDPSGKIINVYSKLHLIGLMQEDTYLTAGDQYRIFEVEQAPAATIICYDLRFPELARTYALEGARILFVPAQWPIQREQHWLALLRARAIENQMYVVGANMSGRNENDVFNGHSVIYDPWGETVAEAGKEPTILYAEIDLNKVADIRQRMPIFKDRKPNLYRC